MTTHHCGDQMPSGSEQAIETAPNHDAPGDNSSAGTEVNRTPRQIVEALNQYIIGQDEAKRAVAVAIRNRWRRRQLDPDMAREVYPKNIVMIGQTGVGKTEIARRLAKLTGAPFSKVEASKFTEVGYHGRDVESMIRDLVDQAISMVRAEQAEHVREKAKDAVTERLIDLMLPGSGHDEDEEDDDEDDEDYDEDEDEIDLTAIFDPEPTESSSSSDSPGTTSSRRPSRSSHSSGYVPTGESGERRQRAREMLRKQLEAGKLEDREVEINQTKKPATSVMFANMGLDQMDPEMGNMFEKLMPEQNKRRRTTIAEARHILSEEETDKLLDQEKITTEAIEKTEQSGLVFLDEIDKVATPGGNSGQSGGGGGGGSGQADISRQGVQRDLLPIVEGSAVSTRHGVVHTDHILFVAAGAFHSTSVSDLMPELQGRFPIRVELNSLTKEDFIRILTEPKGALTKQEQALLAVEGLDVTFDDGSIDAIAELAAKANDSLENIGARRLMTIVEKVFDQVNFDAPERVQRGESTLTITGEFVREQVAGIVQDPDLSKFVL